MRDLVDIMGDENAMMNMGFIMLSDDAPKADTKDEKYFPTGVSKYTRVISSTTEASAKYRKPLKERRTEH